VVEFTIGSRGKVSGKACEKINNNNYNNRVCYRNINFRVLNPGCNILNYYTYNFVRFLTL
jgi:hypothetical protein